MNLFYNFQRGVGQEVANISSWELIEIQTYGGRSVIGLISGASQPANFSIDAAHIEHVSGSPTLSTATNPHCIMIMVRLAFETLDLPNLERGTTFSVLLADAYNPTQGITFSFAAYNDGANHHLYAYGDNYTGMDDESVDMGEVTPGTTFTELLALIYRDKIKLFRDGVAQTDMEFSTSFATTMEAHHVGLAFPHPSECNVKYDSLLVWHKESNVATTLGRVCKDGIVASGQVILIKKSALQTMIANSDAFKVTVESGAYTEACTSDNNYLSAFVLDGNTGGYAEKNNKSAGGSWTKSDFTIS